MAMWCLKFYECLNYISPTRYCREDDETWCPFQSAVRFLFKMMLHFSACKIVSGVAVSVGFRIFSAAFVLWISEVVCKVTSNHHFSLVHLSRWGSPYSVTIAQLSTYVSDSSKPFISLTAAYLNDVDALQITVIPDHDKCPLSDLGCSLAVVDLQPLWITHVILVCHSGASWTLSVPARLQYCPCFLLNRVCLWISQYQTPRESVVMSENSLLPRPYCSPTTCLGNWFLYCIRACKLRM